MKHNRLILLLGVLATVLSCKKKELVPYEKVSANTMLEYKVTNSADTLYGAIDNIKNTITLYIPYFDAVPASNMQIGFSSEFGAGINAWYEYSTTTHVAQPYPYRAFYLRLQRFNPNKYPAPGASFPLPQAVSWLV